MTEIREPTETDILRLVVTLCAARDDEQLVREVLDAELAEWPTFLHAALLKVTLRVVVAQFFGTLARRIERESPDFVDLALQGQAAENEGAPWAG